MYLSRVRLNPRDRRVQRDLADCHALHRRVMSGFPAVGSDEPARAALAVLYRLDVDPRTDEPTLLVQAAVPPDWARLDDHYALDAATKAVDAAYAGLRTGQRLVFRLLANATRKTGTQNGANGRRVKLLTEEEQLDWLRRKAAQGGFRLLSARANPSIFGGKLSGARPAATAEHQKITFGAVLFDGSLEINDADTFRDTLIHGVGPAKAYGFGLLSIAPAGAVRGGPA